VQWTERAPQGAGCFSLGSTMISWFSRKQTSVALSVAEAEYVTTNVASCEAVWIQKLRAGLSDQELETTLIHVIIKAASSFLTI
jgi:hypothetical protein